jgi:hypothetical protein
VDFEEVLGAELLFANVAVDAGAVGGLDVDAVHFEHVSLHKVLVAEFFFANVAIASG